MFAPHIVLSSRLWSTTALRSAVTLLYPLAHSSLALLSLSLSLSLSPHLTVPPSFVLDSTSFSSCSLCVWMVCLFFLSVPSSLVWLLITTLPACRATEYENSSSRSIAQHNATQHKQQQQQVGQATPLFFFFFFFFLFLLLVAHKASFSRGQ